MMGTYQKSDTLAVHLVYFMEISTMVIPCFEQGTITSAYFKLRRQGLVYRINFLLNGVINMRQGNSHV